MIDKNNWYFTNRKYVYSHICINKGGVWMVYELCKGEPCGRAIGTGETVGEAISSVDSSHGVKHYMVKVVDSQ